MDPGEPRMARVGSNHHAVGWSVAMNFLEAHRLVQSFAGGRSRPLRVVLSGTGEPLAIYLKADGAQRAIAFEPSFLTFNTLAQHLLGEPHSTYEHLPLFP